MKNKFLLLLIIAVSLVSCIKGSETVIESDNFSMTLNEKGQVVSLSNPETKQEYILANSNQPLLGLRKFKTDKILEPVSMTKTNSDDKTLLTLTYPDKLQAKVEVHANNTHISFTLLSLSKEELIEAVIWGPLKTTLPEADATAAGIVRGDGYSIGLLGLNIKTLAGFESSGRCRFGNAVQEVQDEGSMLQAFSIDRTSERIGQSGIIAPALPDETVIGSSIALWGCNTKDELDLIGEIEVAENLPHPLIGDVWGKKLPRKYHSKLLTAYSEDNIEDCLKFAKEANIHVVRMKNLFESWGHYKINKHYFPSGLEGLKICVDKAKKEDIILGAHLRLHIHPQDPYVSPLAHPHLASQGETTSALDVSKEDTEIVLADENAVKYYTLKAKNGQKTSDLPRFVRIGTEIITYESVSKDKPYRLLNCKRGVHKTTIMEHKAGTPVAKLVTVTRAFAFFPDAILAKEMAGNLAELVNATGLPHLEFDGYDKDDGHFIYARTLFMKTLYDQLKDKNILHGGSDLLPYHWHYVNLISWGESRTSFRGSMLDYRIEVAKFLRSNLIPIGIGQYKLDKLESVEDMEWLCARAAGNDAGWDLYLAVEGLKNHPLRDEILQVMNTWQTAYIENVFTSEQKELLRDVTREFKLSKTDDAQWKLTQSGTWKPAFSGADKSGGTTPASDGKK